MFLGVAVLDFTHMISYPGMPLFVTPSGVEKTINFWLAARLLGTLALLGAALIPQELIWNDRFQLLPTGVLASVLGFHVWFLFFPDSVPRTFIAGEGLTAFKNNTEYFLMAINAAAAIFFSRSLSKSYQPDAIMLLGAAAVTVFSGYFFTLYGEVTDAYNFLGHIYKIVAYGFLYRGIFVSMVLAPYVELDQSRSHLKATIAALPDTLIELDDSGACKTIHGADHTAHGTSFHYLRGQRLLDIVSLERRAELETTLESVLAGGDSQRIEVSIDQRYFELSIASTTADPSGFRSALVLARDITDRTIRQSEIKKLTTVIDNSPFPVIITDANVRIEYVNEAFSVVSGYSREEALGRNPGFVKSGTTPPEVYKDLWSRVSKGHVWSGEFVNRHKDGQLFTELAHVFPILGSDGNIAHYMAYKENITEQKMIAEQLQTAIRFDPLTGLPNRSLVESRFLNAIDDSQGPSKTTLMIIDIDNFRLLNDALGWGVGDIILKATAMRLQEAIGPGNTLARVGSDEFVALFPSLTSRQAATIAQNLINIAHGTLTVEGREISLTYSIGIARYPEDGNTFDVLSVSAEAATQAAKSNGRNRYHFFAAKLQENASRRHDIGNALRTALDLNQFHLVFQPQQSLHTGACIGAEALLRWMHPKFGLVSPAEFIQIAEDQGSIDEIGDWVTQQVFQTVLSMQGKVPKAVPIAINLSAIQLNQPDLTSRVAMRAAEVGLQPNLIEFELTEAAALKDPTRADRIISALHDTGFSIALDDFGTGYSSFQYLRNLNVQRLKLDQSFITNIVDDAKSRAIAHGIIRLGHTLGMLVIAEGVETSDQHEILTDLECDEIQGFFYSKPLPFENFLEFLNQDQNRSMPM